MEDFNANTEGTASPSPTDVGATGASGADATQGQQGFEPSGQGQETPAPQPDELSAGWSFDENPEQPVIPESDDDLQAMMDDPKLDQTIAPGLVEAIKKARAEARQNFKEARQLREQVAQLESYGGIEGINQTMGLINGLIHNPAEGSIQFLNAVATQAEPAYRQMLNDLIQHESEYLVAGLQANGKIPDAQQGGYALTDEDWERIPQDLREIAKQVPVNQLIEWLDKGTDESLIYNLKREEKLNKLDGAQRQQAEQQWRTATQQAETQGRQKIDDLSGQYEKAHLAQLSKWQPFGPEAGKENQQLYRSILEGAHAELLADKQFHDMYQDALNKLQQAPLRRLKNDHLGADADERDARGLAARYNARLGQVMKGMIQSLDSVFRDARAYRETQRQTIPNRTEISGQSTQAGKNGAPPTLLPNGKTNPAYLDYVVSTLPENTKRPG